MNKLLLGAALILTACAPQKNMMVDLGDVDDYRDFLEERGEEQAPEPFTPEPLLVSATGKVRAQPDIAVITATISAEDKNESRAFDDMSKIVNAVQDALAGRKMETGFTGISSRREFDQTCLNANQLARQRHNQISGDYWFNRRLDQRGDKETKRRAARTRLPQSVCGAQTLKLATQMVIRIQPAEAAGDALRALSDAGAENARLYGYDFTDYDALYQQAAGKAVKMARTKAEKTAQLAGANLGEIKTFYVSGPARTGRFGPQPNVIRPARRFKGQPGSVVDRQTNQRSQTQYSPQRAPATQTCWDGSVITNGGYCPAAPSQSYSDDVIVTGARRKASGFTTFNGESAQDIQSPQTTINQTGEILASIMIPPGNPMPSGQAGFGQTGSGQTTNALSMSLLSGPQTISVTANLSYDYDTPLDGKFIMAEKK